MSLFETFEVIQQVIQIHYWIIQAIYHILQVLAALHILRPHED